MDYTNIQIPFINKELIKRKADLFRQKFWDDSIPVDIEKIIDVKFKIDIIPVPNLEKLCNTDAFIASSWKSIYVDNNSFFDERYLNRFRFSLAHEIGHFILHKDIYNFFNINSVEDFYRFNEEAPREQYGKIETQANIFASFLLVPRCKLANIKEKVLNKFMSLDNADDIDIKLLHSYIARPISKFFGVSPEVIEIVLNENFNK